VEEKKGCQSLAAVRWEEKERRTKTPLRGLFSPFGRGANVENQHMSLGCLNRHGGCLLGLRLGGMGH
jgi:hypothetical protein